MKKPNIVVIGGGTGTFVTLQGLKKYPVDLTAIVTMMDDGGSSGKLRDQLGVLPPGDLRQCLIALSNVPDVWRKLFMYRFRSGDLEGHNFGNVLLSALEKVSSDYETAVEEAHHIMNVQGKVIPVTYNKARVHVLYESGRKLVGEKFLDEESADGSRIKRAYLVPQARMNSDVKEALLSADFIIAGPGDLYSSIIAIALVKGVKEVFKKTKAKLIFNVNLMTKSSQTPDYTAQDHIDDFTKYFGRVPDIVLVNTGPLPDTIIKYYAESRDIPVADDVSSKRFDGRIIRQNLTSGLTHKLKDGKFAQTFAHSIIRHDSKKLAKTLMEIIS